MFYNLYLCDPNGRALIVSTMLVKQGSNSGVVRCVGFGSVTSEALRFVLQSILVALFF